MNGRTRRPARRVPMRSLLWHHPQVTVLDLRMRCGTVIDDTGAPGVRADIGVVGDRIR